MPGNRKVIEKKAKLMNFITRVSPLRKGELGNKLVGYFLIFIYKNN